MAKMLYSLQGNFLIRHFGSFRYYKYFSGLLSRKYVTRAVEVPSQTNSMPIPWIPNQPKKKSKSEFFIQN